tara:strand:- start:53 stop:325 length:273 start_codon:yes stop_codon:yes gene_type:complete
MRDNFRPNVRLATNILMVIGTFLIAINLTSVGKQDKEYIKRRDSCADWVAGKIDNKQMVKVMGIPREPSDFSKRLEVYCTFYGFRNTNSY